MTESKRNGRAFSLYLDEAVQAEAKQRAERDGTSFSALVEELLAKYLGRYAEVNKKLMNEAEEIFLDMMKAACRQNATHIQVEVKHFEAEIRMRFQSGESRIMRVIEAKQGHRVCSYAFDIANVCDSSYRVSEPQTASITSSELNSADLPAMHVVFLPLVDHGRLMTVKLVRKLELPSPHAMKIPEQVLSSATHAATKGQGMVLVSARRINDARLAASVLLEDAMTQVSDKKTNAVPTVAVVSSNIQQYSIPNAWNVKLPSHRTIEESRAIEASAVRTVLNAEPDILFMDMPQSVHTMKLLAEVALCGKRVWISLETPRRLASINRLQDMGVSKEHILETGFIHALCDYDTARSPCMDFSEHVNLSMILAGREDLA